MNIGSVGFGVEKLIKPFWFATPRFKEKIGGVVRKIHPKLPGPNAPLISKERINLPGTAGPAAKNITTGVLGFI